MNRDLTRCCAITLLLLLPGSVAIQAEESTFRQNGVTAHRGDSNRFPENTLRAFQGGIDAGADWVELDIYRTRDGHLIVTHDRTTGRVGDRDLVIADTDLAELRKVDVATEFRRKHGLKLEQCPKETMPTLEEALQLVMQQKQTRVSIQPKVNCVAQAIEIINKLDAAPWCGFNDGNAKFMAEVKRLAPQLPVFWDRPGNSNLDEDIRYAHQHKFESLVLHHSGITAEKINKLHAAGLQCGAWIVNDPQQMRQFLNWGIDRIYTDDPTTLLKLSEKAN